MKRKVFQRLISIILSVFIVFITNTGYAINSVEVNTQPASTITEDFPINISSKSAILMDTVTGQVLIAKNVNEELPPASVTKIMSLLIIMEAIEDGKITLTDTVTVSETAAKKGGSQIWLEVGEKMTVDELLKATVVASANDACTALGEFVAGSESAFISMMNERAKQLGMINTNFENCTGLDDTTDNHYTSAYDIALMSRELLKYNLIIEYSTIWMDYLRDGATELVNTNKLIRTYDGITGLKTGTTSKAGCCVSASATRGNTSFVVVVLGAENSSKRFADAKALLDWGFANYEVYTPQIDAEMINELHVINGVTQRFIPICEKTESILIPKGQGVNVKQVTELADNVAAPIEKGQVVGKIKFILSDEEICSFKLYSEFEIPKMTFSHGIKKLLSVLVD
ncbi:MAG: D-alanyl-D-alanine carboxypeptidase [Clostridia bacterium]|nr:D-alanyl-D-alanine carboxypeptidase [Clostridia bacterium]